MDSAAPATSAPPVDPALAQLRARRNRAFALGEAKARRRVISADAYLFLYKELVTLAGERTYCWPGYDYLVATLETSEGTAKRWMRELERADLIRRQPRPGGQTSLTYITAFLAPDALPAAPPVEATGNIDSAGNPPEPGATVPNTPDPQSHESATAPILTEEPPVFFAPTQEIDSDQGGRSAAIPLTFKNRDLKPRGGGGKPTCVPSSELPPETAATTRLRCEGVEDPDVLRELRLEPVERIERVTRYVARCRRTDDPRRPGLIVHLLRCGFGARQPGAARYTQAGQGGNPNQGDQTVSTRATGDPLRYLSSGFCLHGVHGTCPCCSAPASQDPTHAPDRRAVVSQPRNLDGNEPAALWDKVLTALDRQLDHETYSTWIGVSRLLLIEGDDAVLSTPNVFVRDVIERDYRLAVEAALREVSGRPLALQVVIGT
jgi:hypothetical protein